MKTVIVYAKNGADAKRYAFQLRTGAVDSVLGGEQKINAMSRAISAFCGEVEKCDVLVMLDPGDAVVLAHAAALPDLTVHLAYADVEGEPEPEPDAQSGVQSEPLTGDGTGEALLDAPTKEPDPERTFLEQANYEELVAFVKSNSIELPEGVRKKEDIRAHLLEQLDKCDDGE